MPAVDVPADVALINSIREIEAKIRVRYPAALFDLVRGPENVLHLKTYTDAATFWDPIELVEDDLLRLQRDLGVVLHVIPLRFEDREGCV